MNWSSSNLRDQYDAQVRGVDNSVIGKQTTANETDIRSRQTRQGARPGQSVRNDLKGRVDDSKRNENGAIEKGRRQISEDAGLLSEDYKSSVQIGKISPNHGGNKAVWDTVGASAQQPDIGTPPKFETIGEWHFDKDGVPVVGPRPPETAKKQSDDPPVAGKARH